MYSRKEIKCTAAALLLFLFASAASAIEVAPRISDREIIESLAELKAGQKALEEKMDHRFAAMQQNIDQRFAAIQQNIDQRFAAIQQNIDQRFETMEQSIDQRFEAVDQRFEAVDQRFDAVDKRFDAVGRELSWIWNLQLVVIAGIFGLIGFVVWDRKTALKPLEQRLDRLEMDLHRDLELQNEEGSRLTRLVKVLREMAKQDERLAGVLRSFSLM